MPSMGEAVIIVILIIILFGTEPFGIGDDPSHPDCAAAVPDRCGGADAHQGWQAPRRAISGCNAPGASVILQQGTTTVLVDPLTATVRELPVSPDAVRRIERGWRLLTMAVPDRWHVEQHANGTERRIVVYDRQSGDRVVDAAFSRRIELSTAVVSETGRYTVHVQGNNIASEVTVLDAQRGITWRRDVPHDARLAAYAIDVAFNPGETCAAISTERVGGDGAETWLLDLWSGGLRPLPVESVFILGWVQHHV